MVDQIIVSDGHQGAELIKANIDYAKSAILSGCCDHYSKKWVFCVKILSVFWTFLEWGHVTISFSESNDLAYVQLTSSVRATASLNIWVFNLKINIRQKWQAFSLFQ